MRGHQRISERLRISSDVKRADMGQPLYCKCLTQVGQVIGVAIPTH